MNKKVSMITTVILMTVMVLGMGVVGYATTVYNKSMVCFQGSHIVSGYGVNKSSYFKPTVSEDATVKLDCNAIINTGTCEIGVKIASADGTTFGTVDSDTFIIRTTSQNIDNSYKYGLSASAGYVVFMEAKDGAHLYMNRVTAYYN